VNGTADSARTPNPSPRAGAWTRAFGLVLLLRVGAAGLAFAATALVGRLLGDAVLGRLGLLLAVMDVAAGLAGPALDATLVRFAAQKITPELDGALPYFQRMFRAKLVVALGVLVFGALLAQPVLSYVIAPSSGRWDGAGGVVLAFAGAAVVTLLGFVQAYYQAYLRMARYALLEFANSALRLVLVACVLAAVPAPSASLLLSAYVASSALVAVGGYARLPRAVFRKCSSEAVSLREPLRFAGWVMVAAACTALAQRADVFILGMVGVAGRAIGQYVAAFTMARLGDLAIMTLFSVLLPRASALDSRGAFRQFLNRFVPVTLAALAGCIPVYLAARWAVPAVFGAEFAEAGVLCGILSLGVLASFGAAPAGAAIYGMGRSGFVAALEALKLAGVVAAGAAAARQHGVLGMAWTVTAVRVTIGMLTYLCAYRAAGNYGQRPSGRGERLP